MVGYADQAEYFAGSRSLGETWRDLQPKFARAETGTKPFCPRHTVTEQKHDPIFREIDLSAEARRLWGSQWNAPEVAYRFGDREFFLRTEDSAIYRPQVLENFLLQEDG